MTGFQSEKAIVRAFYDALDTAPTSDIRSVLERFTTPDLLWRGYHPFNALRGPEQVAERFWMPLHRSFSALQRRMDIFFAGRNEMDGFDSRWVVSMGHITGLFDAPFVGIAPTGRMAFLRYCEFHRLEADRIAETAMFFDLPHLMIQAGLAPFDGQAGAHLVQPGPLPHDGLLLQDQPPAEGAKTLATINRMIADLGQWQSPLSLTDELRQSWHEDMIWWGPAGIGATCTIERYAAQHSRPFRTAFSERSKTTHVCRLAEGHYGGFFGWPNFSATLSGDYLGHAATGKRGEFRVIDIYRRQGEKLAENWVFIDLPHFWMQQGVNILPVAPV